MVFLCSRSPRYPWTRKPFTPASQGSILVNVRAGDERMYGENKSEVTFRSPEREWFPT